MENTQNLEKGRGMYFVISLIIFGIFVSVVVLSMSRASATTVYNVLDYGATVDDQVVDTAAIQATINAASAGEGEVFIPQGTFISGPLYVPSNTIIRGAGYTSVISQIASTTSHLISPKDRPTVPAVSNVIIEDIKLLGNSALQNNGGPMPGPHLAKHGIAILGGDGWHINRVWAEDFDGDGVYLGRNTENAANSIARNNIIENSVVRLNVRNGMMISHGEYNTLRGNLFEGNQVGVVPTSPKYAPAMYESAELDIEPNNFNFIEKAIFNTIENNTFRDGNHIGIQMTRSVQIEDNQIVGNTFTDIKKSAITIFSSTTRRTLIKDNVFEATSPDKAANYIRIVRGPDNWVVDNTFSGGVLSVSSSRAITFDAQTAPLQDSVFVGNSIDLTGGVGDGATVFFTSGTVNNYLFGNTFTNAVLDMRGTLASNNPPVINTLYPTTGSRYLSPETVVAEVSASDSDGTIANVDFYLNDEFLGSDTTAPYELSLGSLPVGQYSLRAVARDEHYYFASATSTFSVVTPQPPTVSITAPTTGSLFTAPASILFQATTTDVDGIVTRVDFLSGTTTIGSDTTSPFSFVWNAPLGTSTVVARAYDNDNLQTDSTPVTVRVRQAATIVASDNFISGTWTGGTGWAGTWTNTGDRAIINTNAPYDTPNHARLRKADGFASREVNLAGYATSTLTVAVKAASFEKSESAKIMAKTASGPWVTLKTFTKIDADNVYRVYQLDLTSFVGGLVTIGFDAEMGDTSDNFYFDKVEVSGQPN